ncbi:hypothetical protein [Flaviaesturariibacter terrae]
MKNRIAFVLIIASAIGACNTTPSGDKAGYTGQYYPLGKPKPVDSSEVLHVAYADKGTYNFRVAGNSGVGSIKEGTVSGQLTGPRLGKTAFTFFRRDDGIYEFRAFGSKVDLNRLR